MSESRPSSHAGETAIKSGAASSDSLIGTTVSRFQISARLGEGGMGVVYRARDARLGRDVALKFLAADLLRNDEARERFLQEARAASALDHPNICTIHEIAESEDGRTFIAMAYYEGETLAARIARGPLPVEEAVRIGVQLTDALRAAHARGIVHRDVKPANVLLTRDGGVKLLDFGLAKLADVAITRAGTLLGTARYMSPEQVRAEPVDARTDLWSVGVVLAEMLLGTPPFRGDSEIAVAHSIAHEAPEGLRAIDPPSLRLIVARALEKSRERRYADAVTLLRDLAALEPSRSEPRRKPSIVVLPFVNMSPEPDRQYFSDGLTDEILTDLSKVSALRVISRTSSMMLRGSNKDVPTIARELGVDFVLEGSVRRAGDRLRVTAQLIDGGTDEQLWAERYDSVLADVFEIQETIARRIVEALRLQISPDESRRIGQRPIGEVSAYEAYLRARQLTLEMTPQSVERARQQMQNGLDLVGPNPLFCAGLAYVHFQLANLGIDEEVSIGLAEQYARRALELDPGSAEAHIVLGVIYQAFRGDQAASFRHLQAALERNPDDSHALLWLIVGHTLVGRGSEGQLLAERALAVDPLSPMIRVLPVFNSVWRGGTEHPVAELTDWVRLEPGNPAAVMFSAFMLCHQGHLAEAAALLAAERREGSDVFSACSALLERALRAPGGLPDLVAEPQIERSARHDPQIAYFAADICALAGNSREALRWLGTAVDLGLCNHEFMREHDALLAELRGTPEFVAIVERARAEWHRFDQQIER